MDDIQEPGALTGLRCPVCDGRGWRGFHSLGRVETAQCVACGGTGVSRIYIAPASTVTCTQPTYLQITEATQ
jgi:DnaJ-class molecular chaperone